MENCENCTECEKDIPETVTYIAHQSALYREERNTKKWMRAFAATLALLMVTNVGWLIFELNGDKINLDEAWDWLYPQISGIVEDIEQ